MAATLTREQIMGLSPDDKSFKAGSALASIGKWPLLGCSPTAVWGHCQGSGKKPYQTQIDLSEPAFKCSCPSRKFPCKHGLGLLLLWSAQTDAFTAADPPDWVADWLAGREKRATQKAQRAAAPAKPADPAVAQKRAAQKWDAALAGLDTFERWLHDAVRQGPAALRTALDDPSKRLVDAGLPGLVRLTDAVFAARVRPHDWAPALLGALGRCQAAATALRRLDHLPPPLQADLRTLAGWAPDKESVLAEAQPVRDVWYVHAVCTQERDRLTERRTWLRGCATGRWALFLDFAYGTQGMTTHTPAHVALVGDLAFYPGAYPQRALAVGCEVTTDASPPAGFAHFEAALDAWSTALAANPWLSHFPFRMERVTPVRDGDGWFLVDAQQRALPIQADEQGWSLLAVSGGDPIPLFAEWDGEWLRHPVLDPVEVRA